MAGTSVHVVTGNTHPMTALAADGTATALTTTGAGPWVYKEAPNTAVQVFLNGTSGATGCTVTIEVSNGPDSAPVACATVAATVTLTGTAPTVASDGFSFQNTCWKYCRLNVTAISGTGAGVTGLMGC